jgi:hypothetical protein
MNRPIYPFQTAPRCSATSKRTKMRCGAPAERGKTVCRFHGARGGGPKGRANGAYKAGSHTQEAIEKRQTISELMRDVKDLLSHILV